MDSTNRDPASHQASNAGTLAYASGPDQWYDVVESPEGVQISFPPRHPPSAALREAWLRAFTASAIITGVFAVVLTALLFQIRVPLWVRLGGVFPLMIVFAFFLNREDTRRTESIYRICKQTSRIFIGAKEIHIFSDGPAHQVDLELSPADIKQVVATWCLKFPTGGGDFSPIQPSDSHLTCVVRFVAIRAKGQTHYCVPTVSKREAEDVAAMLKMSLRRFNPAGPYVKPRK